MKKLHKDPNSEEVSILDAVPEGLSIYDRTMAMHKIAIDHGFSWDDALHALEKTQEELLELKEAIEADDQPNIILEYGDVLASVLILAQYLNLSPMECLQKTDEKFNKRFRYMESRIRENGKEVSTSPLEELQMYWDMAKKNVG